MAVTWTGSSTMFACIEIFRWWTLAVDNNSADDMHILDLDVSYGDGSNVITTMHVRRCGL
jgi:hypothetical protein